MSKGKNLEAIVSNEDDIIVGKLLLELLRYMQTFGMVNDSKRNLFDEYVKIGNRLIGREAKEQVPKQTQPQDTNTIFNCWQSMEIRFLYSEML
jgi:hypothetical protein